MSESAAPIRDEAVDPIVALREKWEREPTDAEGWEKRAARALGLAERWRTNAVEWERLARKEAENRAVTPSPEAERTNHPFG